MLPWFPECTEVCHLVLQVLYAQKWQGPTDPLVLYGTGCVQQIIWCLKMLESTGGAVGMKNLALISSVKWNLAELEKQGPISKVPADPLTLALASGVCITVCLRVAWIDGLLTETLT